MIFKYFKKRDHWCPCAPNLRLLGLSERPVRPALFCFPNTMHAPIGLCGIILALASHTVKVHVYVLLTLSDFFLKKKFTTYFLCLKI
jgi:hypothetical protein